MQNYRLSVDGAYTDTFSATGDHEARERALQAVSVEIEKQRSSAVCVTRDKPLKSGETAERIALILVYIPTTKKPILSEATLSCLKEIHKGWYEDERCTDQEPDLIYALDHLDDDFEVPTESRLIARKEIESTAQLIGGLTEIVYLTGDIMYPRPS